MATSVPIFRLLLIFFGLALVVPIPAWSQGICGPMDIAIVLDSTESMVDALVIIKTAVPSIIADATNASEGDLRIGYISFNDTVSVLHPLTADISSVQASILAATAGGGGNTPEASDEAMNTAVNSLASRPGQTGDFTEAWREDAVKIVIFVTDAEPGGFDDVFDEGVDDVAMHTHAVAALAKGILISNIFVPTSGDYAGQARMMRNQSSTTGGVYIQTAVDGTGTGDAIRDIIASCGVTPRLPVLEPVAAVAGVSLAGLLVGLVARLGGVLPESMTDVFQYFLEGVVETKGEVRVKRAETPFPFTGKEVVALAFAAGSLGLAFAYGLADTLDDIIPLLPLALGSAVAIELFKELVRELTARRTGNWSEYRVWPLGLVAMTLSTAIFKAPFAVPGKSWFHMTTPSKRNEGLIAASSSVAGLLTAGAFYLLMVAGARELGALGLSISLALALFELIPTKPLNGKDVFDWSKPLWALLFSVSAVLYTAHLLLFG